MNLFQVHLRTCVSLNILGEQNCSTTTTSHPLGRYNKYLKVLSGFLPALYRLGFPKRSWFFKFSCLHSIDTCHGDTSTNLQKQPQLLLLLQNQQHLQQQIQQPRQELQHQLRRHHNQPLKVTYFFSL
jgi:hypothetical protein